MGAKRTTAAVSKTTARKVATKRRAKSGRAASARSGSGAKRRSATPAKSTRPTLAMIAAQLEALREQVAALTELVRARGEQPGSELRLRSEPLLGLEPSTRANGHPSKGDRSAFDAHLLAIVADLDRSARHAGLVPIPAIRRVFLERGWTRDEFDKRLLEAERDFVVDLKSANDPSRLEEPELAIQQPGRGYLQYVVTR
jgi:hypothetical protein